MERRRAGGSRRADAAGVRGATENGPERLGGRAPRSHLAEHRAGARDLPAAHRSETGAMAESRAPLSSAIANMKLLPLGMVSVFVDLIPA